MENERKNVVMQTKEEFLSCIIPELVNAKTNARDLADSPHRMLSSEIAVMYTHMVIDSGIVIRLHINSGIAEAMGIVEQELYEAAVRNMNGQYIVVDMQDILGFGPRDEMVVITNESAYKGAACILQEDALKDASRMLGGDFLAIPSSIHEFICITGAMGADPAKVKEISSWVNTDSGCVERDDILGTKPLFYDSKAGILKEVDV